MGIDWNKIILYIYSVIQKICDMFNSTKFPGEVARVRNDLGGFYRSTTMTSLFRFFLSWHI